MSEKDKEEIVKEILILDKKETLNSHDEFMLALVRRNVIASLCVFC